ncbi:MAG TPA: hypothetical protein VGR90_05335 [Acidimicrobiales bacterium]|nr:hypothetical protein [Acidimicrobiales bacterium]
MSVNGFHRVDPSGKQALFDPGVMAAPDRLATGPRNEGKAALFSSPPRTPGTVVVECSRCQLRSRVGLVDLLTRFVTGSVWLPFLGRYQHWMRCPGCGRREWCRVGWTE